MAEWRQQYGVDGIDLDIEEGAGSRAEAGPNLVHFIRYGDIGLLFFFNSLFLVAQQLYITLRFFSFFFSFLFLCL